MSPAEAAAYRDDILAGEWLGNACSPTSIEFCRRGKSGRYYWLQVDIERLEAALAEEIRISYPELDRMIDRSMELGLIINGDRGAHYSYLRELFRAAGVVVAGENHVR